MLFVNSNSNNETKYNPYNLSFQYTEQCTLVIIY